MGKTYAELGSVSHGTMRAEDLIPAFMSALDDLREQRSFDAEDCHANAERHGREDDELGAIERRMEQEGYYSSEDADFDLERLFDMLNEYAPEGAYFGAHPGDGSDYGFWNEEG